MRHLLFATALAAACGCSMGPQATKAPFPVSATQPFAKYAGTYSSLDAKTIYMVGMSGQGARFVSDPETGAMSPNNGIVFQLDTQGFASDGSTRYVCDGKALTVSKEDGTVTVFMSRSDY